MTKPTTILILIILSLLCLNPACYAKVRYVNTASVGGDGPTNNLTGATAAYKSLFDWEAAEDGIPLTEPMIVYCEGTAADTQTVAIAGWTGNSADNYILITTTQANRHKGKWDTAYYHREVTNNYTLKIDENYVRVDGLQLGVIVTPNNQGHGIVVAIIAPGGSDIRVSNCIIKALSVAGTGASYGINLNDTECIASVYNTTVQGFVSGTEIDFCGMRFSVNTADVYNSVINNCGLGMLGAGGTVTTKNTLVFENNDDWFGTIVADYCASDDEDASTYTNGIDISGQTTDDYAALVLDADGGDFHITDTNSVLYDAGYDLYTGGDVTWQDDIDGQTRPWVGGADVWDIGADEYYFPTVTIKGATLKGVTVGGQ